MLGKGFAAKGWTKRPRQRGVWLWARLLLGFIIWSFFGALLAYSLGLGLSLYTLGIGVGLGLIMVSLLHRALTAKHSAEPWTAWFLWPARLACCAILALFAVQLYVTGALPVVRHDYLRSFDRLVAAISAHYPYFEAKEIDWDERRVFYRDAVANAASDHTFLLTVAEMLAEFHDGHAYVTADDSGLYGEDILLGSVQRVGDEYVVRQLRPGLGVAGLVPGAVIIERDGLSTTEYIDQLDPWFAAGSSPGSRTSRALNRLLVIPLHATTYLTIRTLDSEIKHIALHGADLQPTLPPVTRPAVRHDVLESGVGYIEVTTFALGQDVVAAFDKALATLHDAPGLIIDVRRNGGGSSWYADRIAGRFLVDAFEYARVAFRYRLPQFGWVSEQTWRVVPRGEPYVGTVVILTGPQTMSAAEAFVVALQDSGRALVVGEPTAGEVGVPITFNLPGGRASFTVGSWQRLVGPEVEGIGVTPDIAVAPVLADIINQEDTVLKAAIDYLLQLRL